VLLRSVIRHRERSTDYGGSYGGGGRGGYYDGPPSRGGRGGYGGGPSYRGESVTFLSDSMLLWLDFYSLMLYQVVLHIHTYITIYMVPKS